MEPLIEDRDVPGAEGIEQAGAPGAGHRVGDGTDGTHAGSAGGEARERGVEAADALVELRLGHHEGRGEAEHAATGDGEEDTLVARLATG